jgi:DNA-binding IclR family transcriptional regulator
MSRALKIAYRPLRPRPASDPEVVAASRSSCGQQSIDSVHEGANTAYCEGESTGERSMPRARNLLLTQAQAACLSALRSGGNSQSKIAMQAKLGLAKATAALRKLAELGLARRHQTAGWQATPRGKTCRFDAIPGRPRRDEVAPSPSGRRLLELLDRPMRGRQIVKELGMSRQGVHQLLIKLYAQGHVRFADPENPLWLVMRAEDKTPALSRGEERVLSVVPREYATDAIKIRSAAGVPDAEIHEILERLLLRRLIEASQGLRGNQVYRLTDAGLTHPQRVASVACAQAPRPPVESERVRKVLSAIFDSGELRIKDVTNTLSVPHQSMNALMQYLKRKRLVRKNGRELHSPYALTAQGIAALAEMTRTQAVLQHRPL